jgi:hypothetical protein
MTCGICLEDIADDDPLREITICGHAFHSTCLDGHRYTNTCPTCRGPLVHGQPQQGSDYNWGQYDPGPEAQFDDDGGQAQAAPVSVGQFLCWFDPPLTSMGPGCLGAARTAFLLGDFVQAQHGTEYICGRCEGTLDLHTDLYMQECEHYMHAACAV